MWLSQSLDGDIKAFCREFSLPFDTDISIFHEEVISLKSLFLPEVFSKSIIVCDRNTVEIVRNILSPQEWGIIPIIILENERNSLVKLSPNIKNVNLIIEKINHEKAKNVICVGSGTLNDLSKYASFCLKIPYTVIATAPSMNGYISQNASIIQEDNLKTSLMAHLPKNLVIHIPTIKQAPRRLLNSGFADFMAKNTAQADWMLSKLYKNTDYIPRVFAILEKTESFLLKNYNANNLQKNDIAQDLTSALMENLILSGIGMYVARGSSPASGGEHILSHFLEKENYEAMKYFFHGEHVAVTTLSMLKIQRVISEKIQFKLPYDTDETGLKTLYKSLGIPTAPNDIGISNELYTRAIGEAYKLRDRFGFLDLYNN